MFIQKAKARLSYFFLNHFYSAKRRKKAELMVVFLAARRLHWYPFLMFKFEPEKLKFVE